MSSLLQFPLASGDILGETLVPGSGGWSMVSGVLGTALPLGSCLASSHD